MSSPYIAVLDLDETLIHYMHDNRNYDIGNSTDFFYMENDDIPVVIRPHFFDMYKWLVCNMDYICVYTAGSKSYAESITAGLFSAKGSLSALWSNEDCLFTARDVYKPLYDKKIGNIAADSPRTLFIDDRSTVCDYNVYARRSNLFNIKGFYGDADDTQLLDFIDWATDWKENTIK